MMLGVKDIYFEDDDNFVYINSVLLILAKLGYYSGDLLVM